MGKPGETGCDCDKFNLQSYLKTLYFGNSKCHFLCQCQSHSDIPGFSIYILLFSFLPNFSCHCQL